MKTTFARMASRLVRPILDNQDRIRLAIGRAEARAVRAMSPGSLREVEFRVFSQWGEDGILQYLVSKVPIRNEIFVEFGVQDYAESNTRFLLCNDNWRGLIMDAGTAHARFVEDHGLRWRYTIDTMSAFITRENVNDLIREAGIGGDIGLLSIDIDGNDYWVLQAVDVVSPRILVVEYNSTFGASQSITVPYSPTFRRREAHYSNLYYGASLAALCHLAGQKGYVFVGGNSAGNNAFFVRSDVASGVRAVNPEQGWAASRFRESLAEDGLPSLVSSHRERLAVIADLPVIEIPSGRQRTIRELFLA